MSHSRSAALTGTDRKGAAEDLRELYEAGCSIRSVAARFKRSYGLVHQLLVEAGTPFRDHAGRPRKVTG